MNPLSPLTYYGRHKRGTLLLAGLISLMTLGVCVMVRLLDAVPENFDRAGSYLTRVSLVSAVGPSLDPGVGSQIRAHPDVAQVIREKGLDITLPPFAGEHHLFGVSESDMQALMDIGGLRLKEGRLPRPRTNEMALSEEMARAMGIRVGDQVDRSVGQDWTGESFYEEIPTPLELVGILEGADSRTGIRMGFVSYEYVRDHELFGAPWRSGLVVISQEGRKTEVDKFLETEIASSHAEVMTHRRLSGKSARLSTMFHVIFGVVDGVVAAVMALVVGMISHIAQTRRLEEFGLLSALGYSKRQLVRRLTLETVGIAGMGWLVGVVLSWLLFVVFKTRLYEPRGMVMGLVNLTPIWFSIPIPLAVAALVTLSTVRTLARLDAVAIVERGKFSMEASSERQAARRSLVKPLSSWVFYLRHRRRGLILIVTMSLMVLGVSFPAFLFAPLGDAMQAFAEPLRQIGIIRPRMGGAVDPGVAAQVRVHPTVAHVIPAVELELPIRVPPMGWPISVYGVSESDMQTLVDLYGVGVKQGRLPRPRTNEIVLSEAVALNRGLHVGAKVGRPVGERDVDIPTEMVVVGILSRPSQGQGDEDLWMGFASYEYLDSHELYVSHPIHLLVVPTKGRKVEMDAWLRQDVHSGLAEVLTFNWLRSNYRILALILLLVFGVVESIVAVVAAVALAVLSYTFFVQRREEFGILHAVGHSRLWLVLRTLRETASLVAVAWLLGAMVCGVGLVYIQVGVYAPKGLRLNLFNPMPWLFTLPMPLAVVAVSAGLVAWMLSRLDAVSVIEKR